MSRRWLSIWLPNWPVTRWRRVWAREPGHRGQAPPSPFALVHQEDGVPRLHALDAAARAVGLAPGRNLTDARAALPGLAVADADPQADTAALEALALFAGRWSPWVALGGREGIDLDITGCAHLFAEAGGSANGEGGLLRAIAGTLRARAIPARLAIADRLLAARAWARHGRGGILDVGGCREALSNLPIRALEIEAETQDALRRLGFERIGQLLGMPRAALHTRFGRRIGLRLAQLFDDADYPFVPLRPPARFAARLAWPEPIGRTEDIEAALRRLLDAVCRDLERAQQGARRIRCELLRIDGGCCLLEAGTGRPVRDPGHLLRLLRLDLDGLDVGFGIEVMLLEVTEAAPFEALQAGLADRADETALARLADQLTRRLGRERVQRLQPLHSHWPESAVAPQPAGKPLAARPWMPTIERPSRLLARPRPLEALALLPDGPPARLGSGRHRRRVAAAQGPERILPEWWHVEGIATSIPEPRLRDYWRILLEDGHRLWVFREGAWEEPRPPIWALHGLFD